MFKTSTFIVIFGSIIKFVFWLCEDYSLIKFDFQKYSNLVHFIYMASLTQFFVIFLIKLPGKKREANIKEVIDSLFQLDSQKKVPIKMAEFIRSWFVRPSDPMVKIYANGQLMDMLKEMPLETLQAIMDAKSVREMTRINVDERLKVLLKEIPPAKLQAIIDAKTIREKIGSVNQI